MALILDILLNVYLLCLFQSHSFLSKQPSFQRYWPTCMEPQRPVRSNLSLSALANSLAFARASWRFTGWLSAAVPLQLLRLASQQEVGKRSETKFIFNYNHITYLTNLTNL